MRYGLRGIRLLLGSIIMLAVALGTVGYVVYAANGILNEVEARDIRQDHDALVIDTATALVDHLTAVAEAEAAVVRTGDVVPSLLTDTDTPLPPSTLVAQVATETPPPSDTPTEIPLPSDTPTGTPTVTPSPPTVTPIPTNTLRATVTPIPTNTLRPSATPAPTETPLPTETPTATATFTPSLTSTPTATYTPSIEPTPTYVIEGTYTVPFETPIVEIPLRMPLMDMDENVVNFLLLGSDTSGGGVGRTDVVIVVSVNKRVGSVAMWHLPRDLIVYVPNHTMDRINLVYALGESSGYTGGGFGLMKEMFLYNFGITIDHYARVDFDDFMRVVEELGGLEVSVDCAIQDWRLIEPEFDPTLEESWEQYTMPIGRQTLDPYMALWYVRSRITTNDLDRGRRQMDALRAMWYQAREQGLFTQVTQLWPEAAQVVETDMTLTDVLSFAPLAVSLDISYIARYSGTMGVHFIPFVTPDDKREVMLPDREQLMSLIQDFLTPPTENRLGRQSVTVEVIDASAYYIGFELVAVDRLAWEGFAARPLPGQADNVRDLTVVYDYTGQIKGSALDDLKRILRVGDAQVIVQPDPNRSVDYRVEIGRGYNSCVYGNAEDEIDAGPPVEEYEPTPVNVG